MQSLSHVSVQSLRGRVLSFNLSPKGVPEGLILKLEAGSIIQINFSPDIAGGVTDVVSIGDELSVQAIPFRDAEADAHPVFDMLGLTNSTGIQFTADGPPQDDVEVEGRVQRINYARRGEPNGGILDTGDFVHLRPHGARAIGLKLGMKLKARGEVRPGWSNCRVIEAHVANGVKIEKPHKPHPPKHKPHPPA